MIPIGQIGRKFGLSRSTLLYYDRLGLIRPTYRTAAGYRLYSADDEARLKQVCCYRKAGLPLAEIALLLDDDDCIRDRLAGALRRRLSVLNEEIAVLRRQHQLVLELLPGKRGQAGRLTRTMTKEKWIALLRATGLNDEEMGQWHAAFELQSPLAHQDFLESLGIMDDEIQRIRNRSRSFNESARKMQLKPRIS